MGCMNREFSDEQQDPSSINEAFLFTTMCIIGLPVEVHIKDGSVYSGIFHTASLDKGYDIVLKKAMMTKKGKHTENLPQVGLIETLVVLSRDLVQVVAKGVLFQADAIDDVVGEDLDGFGGTVPSSRCSESEGKPTKLKLLSAVNEKCTIQTRQVADGKSNGEPDDCKQQFEIHREQITSKLHDPSLRSRACTNEEKPVDKFQAKMAPNVLPNGVSCSDIPSHVQADNQCCKRPTSAEIQSSDAISSGGMNSFSSDVDLASESCHSSQATSSEVVSSQSFVSNRSTKGFKLNPGAKVFSPSSANTRPATTPSVPTAPIMTYLPNNSPLVSIDAAEIDMDMHSFASRSSLPVKFVPYSNMMAENGYSGSQYNQSIIGYPGNRMQPVRQTGQYHPVQSGSAYVPLNPQAVVVGRMGQIVYVHPVSQGAAATSPVSARPLLMPHQVQFPKHQGYAAAQGMQLYAPPPFVTTGQQPFAVANHVQHLQPPFPANRPIVVPNGLVGSKFP